MKLIWLWPNDSSLDAVFLKHCVVVFWHHFFFFTQEEYIKQNLNPKLTSKYIRKGRTKKTKQKHGPSLIILFDTTLAAERNIHHLFLWLPTNKNTGVEYIHQLWKLWGEKKLIVSRQAKHICVFRSENEIDQSVLQCNQIRTLQQSGTSVEELPGWKIHK